MPIGLRSAGNSPETYLGTTNILARDLARHPGTPVHLQPAVALLCRRLMLLVSASCTRQSAASALSQLEASSRSAFDNSTN